MEYNYARIVTTRDHNILFSWYFPGNGRANDAEMINEVIDLTNVTPGPALPVDFVDLTVTPVTPIREPINLTDLSDGEDETVTVSSIHSPYVSTLNGA